MPAPKDQFMPTAREQYDRGAPLNYLRRKYHMSDSELKDMAPEEFDDDNQSENITSGY